MSHGQARRFPLSVVLDLAMPQGAMERAQMQKECERMLARLREADGRAFDHEFIVLMTKHQ